MELKARVERGAWVVIAGDRSRSESDRVSMAPFLGQPAPFSQGPYILASLLDCPVYTLFCVRRGDTYQLDVEKLADRIQLPRQDRAGALTQYVGQFAARLERYAVGNPLQWYNFFDFLESGPQGTARMITAECEIVAQFYDIDPMQVVWHGNYVRYFERVRGLLLDKIDYNYPTMEHRAICGPRVSTCASSLSGRSDTNNAYWSRQRCWNMRTG